MPKLHILIAGVVGAGVIVGGVLLVTNNKDEPKSKKSDSSQSSSKEVKLDDPAGDYKLFSDPSVTKYPDEGAIFGGGQTLTFEYDGSKTNNDAYATLSYQLYYIQDNGKVIPMGGGNVEGKGSGIFTVSDKQFTSGAKDRSGFLELTGTYDTGLSETGQITGKNVVLGMYSVKFDISE